MLVQTNRKYPNFFRFALPRSQGNCSAAGYDFWSEPFMKKLTYLVSLTTKDNDYQAEQAAMAEDAARRLGVTVQIIFAENDSIVQSRQILQVIQSRSGAFPDAILFEPAGGTSLPQLARAAVAAGIGWVVLNRDVDYLCELRQAHPVPIFGITSDHEEIGRIQGRQFGALLPRGGSVLYITGPADSPSARQRTEGMYVSKPADVQVKIIKAHWTEASAHRAVASWLRLSASRQSEFQVVAAQNDAMAAGAQRAFQELPDEAARDRWLHLPFIGCDGLPLTGAAWVNSGLLAATIVVPSNTGQALDLLVSAAHGASAPPERTLTVPVAFPSVELLGAAHAEKTRALSAQV